MNIYISSSWKNRDAVRSLAIQLRFLEHGVYDFTDPQCRETPEIPPEKFTEQFNPDVHNYRDYIVRDEWRAAVMENRRALCVADAVILLLPCGVDAHADWAFAVGRGARSAVVGNPAAGERHPVHLWADAIVDTPEDAIDWIRSLGGAEA